MKVGPLSRLFSPTPTAATRVTQDAAQSSKSRTGTVDADAVRISPTLRTTAENARGGDLAIEASKQERAERIAKVKASVQSGTYSPPQSRQLAEKLSEELFI